MVTFMEIGGRHIDPIYSYLLCMVPEDGSRIQKPSGVPDSNQRLLHWNCRKIEKKMQTTKHGTICNSDAFLKCEEQKKRTKLPNFDQK